MLVFSRNITSISYIFISCEDIDDVIYNFLHWIYIMKRKLNAWLEDINFIFSWWNQYITHFPRSSVKYYFHYSKIKSISLCCRVNNILYLLPVLFCVILHGEQLSEKRRLFSQARYRLSLEVAPQYHYYPPTFVGPHVSMTFSKFPIHQRNYYSNHAN